MPEPQQRSRPKSHPAAWAAELGRSSSLGLAFAATFLGCAGLGYLVDRWVGTYPVLMALGLFLGAGGGFVKLVRTVGTGPKARSDADAGKEKGDQ